MPGPLRVALINLASGAFVACAGAVDTPSGCQDCRIEVERVAMLGALDGPGALPGAVTAVARHPDGSVLVGTWPGEQVLIFDTTGRHLASIGRKGEGPGEFGGGIDMHGIVRFRGDSILVIDGGNRRLTTFSRAWEVGWTAPDPSAYGGGLLVALATGGFVRSGEVPGAAHVRRPLHLLDARGQLVRSFGGTGAMRLPAALYPVLAPSADRSVWVLPMTRYRVELWSPDDTLLRTIDRNAEWFAPRDDIGSLLPDQRPLPMAQAIHRDSLGRLWIAVKVGADDWASGLGAERRSAAGRDYEVLDPELIYDTMIDVLDEATGTPLASVRIPQIIHSFVDGGLAAVAFEDELGVPRVELLRLRVVER